MRFRITQTITTEYEVDPQWCDAETAEEMLALDIEAAEDDPGLFMSDGANIVTTGEIIKEENENG